MFLKTRIDRPELMDTLRLSPKDMTETLDFLTFTNMQFGGADVVLSHFHEWSRGWAHGASMTVLDVGTGAADIPLALSEWASKKKFSLQITGIDIIPEIVDIARDNTANRPEIKIQQVNIETLAWAGHQYDYVIGSLFLHHIAPREQIKLLGIFDQLARRGVLISDLLRTLPSYLAVSAASTLFGNRIARHDGPLSVRRSFTVTELNQLAHQARLPYLQARREPWFRVSLSGEKPRAD
jgi:2-polyprenyl-3-methyl-5-hydroxy-6-metoxy-1,4-benzoquinol methylase